MRDTKSLIHDLVTEREHIKAGHNKLADFISCHGSELKNEQLEAMETQRSAMFVYAYSLGVRISLLQKEI